MAQLAAQGQRSGKFRHVYGEAAKPEGQYKELSNPMTSGEARYVSCNGKFFAVSKAAGGGPVYIRKYADVGRIPSSAPMLSVQKGKVLDHDFHPFISNMIATASEDCSLAVTSFPKDGLTEHIKEASVLMKGHGKKVALCQFNPCANSILASGAFDRTIKIWNIEHGGCVQTFEDMKDNVYSMEWNQNGSQLAVTGKDKKLRIFDPRKKDESASVEVFEGAKSSKCFWMPNLNWIGAVGFSKGARRQLRFWDLKNLQKPIYSNDIDQVASVLMPYYDNDTGLLYMSGKGDGTVSYGEVINDAKKYYMLGAYRAPEPQKGGGWIPKRACSVFKCEVERFLKLTKNSIIPISFIVPRKAGGDVFQEDIYPHAFAGRQALSSDDWLKGSNKEAITMNLDPEKRSSSNEEDTQVFHKKQSREELEAENAQLKKYIKELEAKLGIEPKAEAEAEEQKENAEEAQAQEAEKEKEKADESAGADKAAEAEAEAEAGGAEEEATTASDQ